MNIFFGVIGVLVAYLIGSFSSAVWIGKWFYKIDVRKQGSGNAGATNTLRVLGLKPGIVVLLLDAFKGWLAVELAYLLPIQTNSDFFINYQIVLAVAVVIGHVFPLYTGFKGGKGVATLVGVIIALVPVEFGITFLIFAFIFICFHYVSLASIISALAFPFIVIFWEPNPPIALVIFSILLGIFIPLTHKKNIQRLCKGTESKIWFKKKH
ncbi:MAG: glycerol-3-phosphate 1-O-acyltransferase PlsY [Bacteroidales bacterium]